MPLLSHALGRQSAWHPCGPGETDTSTNRTGPCTTNPTNPTAQITRTSAKGDGVPRTGSPTALGGAMGPACARCERSASQEE